MKGNRLADRRGLSLAVVLAALLAGCGRPAAQRPPTTRPASAYLANRSSGVVHKATCRYAPKILPRNRVPFGRLDNALTEGFRPCAYCLRRASTSRPAKAEEIAR